MIRGKHFKNGSVYIKKEKCPSTRSTKKEPIIESDKPTGKTQQQPKRQHQTKK